MKAYFFLCLPPLSATVAPATAQPAARSPLLGTWAVDVSKLPIPPEQRPKSVTFTYSEASDGKWATQVDIVAPDGSATHGTTSYLRDGTAWPVQGSPEADTTAVMTPQPGVLVMALSKGACPARSASTRLRPTGRA